jgi:TPP-dependent pyruvate/acetoin dehydrogenase alpha subunit
MRVASNQAPPTDPQPEGLAGDRPAATGDEPGTGPARHASEPPHLDRDDRTALFRFMVLHRAIEERGVSLYKQGKVPGSFYDGRGQEATCVGAAFALGPADPICPLIRDLGAHLVKGTSPRRILAHYLGRPGGVSAAREGNVHFGDATLGVLGMVSMLPDMMPVAVGMAMAFKLRREPRCSLALFGDGATSVGDWHEAMNFAAVQQVPAIFVLEHNGYAYSTPSSRQFAIDPVERAAAYGMPGVSVDGNDVEAVFEVVRQARERALAGDGPTLIAAHTMRMHGHGLHDDARYVPAEQLAQWAERDPVALQRDRLVALGVDTEAISASVAADVDQATTEALAMAMPDPATATTGVYCDGEAVPIGAGLAPWSGFR